MNISLDEYRRRLRESNPAQERVRQLRAELSEAVAAHALTGDPNWDRFLAKVQGRITAYKDNVAAQQTILCHPETVNVDRIMEAKIKIVALEAARQALEEILDLPKLLIERGAEASETLKGIQPAEE